MVEGKVAIMWNVARRDVLRWSAGLLLPAVAPSLLRAAEGEGNPLAFSEMYLPGGTVLTAKLQRLDGKLTTVRGYMAPPLKPDAPFFVLTSVPMAACPFCDNSLSWPDSIIFVRTRDAVKAIDFDRRIAVTGRLELGVDIDKDTGFVSLVRLIDAKYARV